MGTASPPSPWGMSLPFTGVGEERPPLTPSRSWFVAGAGWALMLVAVPGKGAMGWGGLGKSQIFAGFLKAPLQPGRECEFIQMH